MADLDATFVDAVQSIATSGNEAEAALGGTLGVPWFGSELDGAAPDVLNVPALGDPFSRAQLGVKYAKVLSAGSLSPVPGNGEASQGAATSYKFQSDYLAAMERALRQRHTSPIRRKIHAANRRSALASPAATPGQVIVIAQNMLAAGAATDTGT